MPVKDTLGRQTSREKWIKPHEARGKVLGRDVLPCSTAGQVLARRPPSGVVPPVLPQRSKALVNLEATSAYVTGMPAESFLSRPGAVSGRSRHTKAVACWTGGHHGLPNK